MLSNDATTAYSSVSQFLPRISNMNWTSLTSESVAHPSRSSGISAYQYANDHFQQAMHPLSALTGNSRFQQYRGLAQMNSALEQHLGRLESKVDRLLSLQEQSQPRLTEATNKRLDVVA